MIKYNSTLISILNQSGGIMVSDKTARIGMWSTVVLVALSIIIPATIAMVSLADGERAGEIAATSYLRDHMFAAQGELEQKVIAGVVADWDAQAVATAVYRSARADVPSVKIAEAIFPWVSAGGLIFFVFGLLVFGESALFTVISDRTYRKLIRKEKTR